MAFANIYLGENVQTFNSSPKFDRIDMVILNIDENTYVSSPYVKIDREVWEQSSLRNSNGKFVFTYDPESGSWKRGSSVVDLASYGITITYNVESMGAKAGDTITVNRMGETKTTDNPDPKIELHIELTRSGRTMEANCPLCKPPNRQEIADRLLASLSSYGYQPFTASGATVNPLAELGDGITVHGVYGGLYQQDLDFGSLMASEISAPGEQELEHEFTYQTANERKYGRKFADIAAEFEIHADEIAARVTREGTGDGFSWSLIETGFSVKAGNKVIFRVDKDGTYVDGSGKFTGQIVGGSISIGSNFSVDTSGNMKATNAELTGTLKVGGTDILAAVLQAGAQSAYTNGGNWTSAFNSTSSGGYCFIGSGFGYDFSNMTKQNYTANWVVANHILCYSDGEIYGHHSGYWVDTNSMTTNGYKVSWKYINVPTSVTGDAWATEWVWVDDAAKWAVGDVSGSAYIDDTKYLYVLGN